MLLLVRFLLIIGALAAVALTVVFTLISVLARRPVNARIIVWALVGAVVVVLLHPFLFGIPGVVGEIRFRLGLRDDMTRTDALRLSDKIGYELRVEDKPAELEVWYSDFGTYCLVGGNAYHLDFDRKNHLSSWRTYRWNDGC